MNRITSFILCVCLFFSLTACEKSNNAEQATQPQKEVQKLSVRIPWIRTSATVGLEVADELGYFKKAGLEVAINPGSAEASPLRKVLTGEDQFGLLEPAQVLVGVANQDMPLVILAIKAQKSPFCLMSKTENSIKTLKDMEGKRVGYNPLNDVSYLAMLKKGNIDRSKLNEIRVQFNLEPFLQGQVDVWPSYISNEPVVAKRRGLDVNLICADDVGVHLYEHALFARKDFVAKNSEAVEKFVRAWIEGWQYTIRHPEKAVDIVVKRIDGLDRENELKVVEVFNELVTAGEAATKGIGWVDRDMIDNVSSTLMQLGIIQHQVDTTQAVDNSFVIKANNR
jgi:NitT/TauT family transport system substrate-binding protein